MLRNRPADKPAAGKVAYLQRRTAATINYVRNISKLLGGLNCHDKIIECLKSIRKQKRLSCYLKTQLLRYYYCYSPNSN